MLLKIFHFFLIKIRLSLWKWFMVSVMVIAFFMKNINILRFLWNLISTVVIKKVNAYRHLSNMIIGVSYDILIEDENNVAIDIECRNAVKTFKTLLILGNHVFKDSKWDATKKIVLLYKKNCCTSKIFTNFFSNYH